ncbi:MAG: response regulator [Lachnospiraceae bacterium]|nr:response regulator [Lachnospiraceae bacterium]
MTEKYKALVVDDNDVNATISVEKLNSFELEASIAVSGTEAIRMIRENNYAFVLMDYIMPEMNGVEATRRIREFSNVPVYAMSEDREGGVAEAFVAAGANGMIAKPPRISELIRIIRSHVPEGSYKIEEGLLLGGADDGARTYSVDSEAERMKSFMSMVSGLNVMKGLMNAGGIARNYIRLVKAASGDIRDYMRELSDYLKTGDPTLLKHASHCLKIVFSNIGFEELTMVSERIEVWATDLLNDAEIKNTIPSFTAGHQESVTEYISHTMTAILQLDDAIEGYIKSLEETGPEVDYSAPVHPLTDDEIEEVREYTAAAIDRFEIDYVLEGLNLLKDAFCGDARRKTEAAIEAAGALDYVTVKKLFDDLFLGRGEAR